MVIALVLLFVIAASLSFFEDRISDRDKKILYILLGIAMILIAGLREVGSTPDSIDYERMYYGKSDKVLDHDRAVRTGQGLRIRQRDHGRRYSEGIHSRRRCRYPERDAHGRTCRLQRR